MMMMMGPGGVVLHPGTANFLISTFETAGCVLVCLVHFLFIYSDGVAVDEQIKGGCLPICLITVR